MPLQIVRNDIALMGADVIVCPANSALVDDGGGVCHAVHAAAGAERMREACRGLAPCPVGGAVVAPGFDLPAKHVVFAVGPTWSDADRGGDAPRERELLARTYRSAFEAALSVKARSIAVPLLSAGAFGFPQHVSFEVAVEQARAVLGDHDVDISIVVYGRPSLLVAAERFEAIAELIDDAYVDRHRPYPNRGRSRGPYGQRRYDAGAFGPAEDVFEDEGPAWRGEADAAEQAGRETSSGPLPQDYARPMAKSAASAPSRPSAPQAADAPRAAGLPQAAGAPPVPASAPAPRPAATVPSMPKGRPKARDRLVGAFDDLRRKLLNLDASFSESLLALIDQQGLTDAQVYKRANISRQLFAKIRKGDGYRPTKQTALALAIALRLDRAATNDLIGRAGIALSESSAFDVIVAYFIDRGIYDVDEVNAALFAFDQPLLGSGA